MALNGFIFLNINSSYKTHPQTNCGKSKLTEANF